MRAALAWVAHALAVALGVVGVAFILAAESIDDSVMTGRAAVKARREARRG